MAQRQQKIIPTGELTGYLEARRSTKNRGGLPPNRLHTHYLVETNKWKQLPGYYTAWANEILAHPEKDGQFQKGRDVVDSKNGWTVPAYYLQKAHEEKEVFGRAGVGLAITPEDIPKEGGKRIVHPKSIVVLHGLPQESGGKGKADETTGIPLQVSEELWNQLSDKEKAWLYRIAGVGVGPVLRNDCVFSGRRNVYANGSPDYAFGVAYVGLEEATPKKLQLQKDPEDNGILVKGVTLTEFRQIVGDAHTNLTELADTIKPEELTAIKRLVQALEIKE